MVAAFDVFLDTAGTDTSPGTETDIDALGPPALRFKTADNPTIDAVNPVPIPSSGTNYSFWKSIYLKCSTAPDTQVDNVQFFTDGTLGWGTGVTLNVGLQFPTKKSTSDSGYIVAVGTIGTTGTEMVSGHSSLTTSASAFDYTSGSTLAGPSISEDGSIINATGESTDYLILQVNVLQTASPGNKTDETLTLQYDEI